MPVSLPVIKIKAKTSHHGGFLIVIGCSAMILTLILSHYFWFEFRLTLIYLILVALVVLLTGILKRFEPKYSLKLKPQGICYFHKVGQWQLSWQQIQSINQVKETSGLTRLELPYIGIRLVNLESLVKQISPRLANRLIHEQKPLIAFALMHQLMSWQQSQLNFSPFQLQSGESIKGPLAAFLHHSQMLYSSFGYHLVIPEGCIDRDIAEFCLLLRQCKASAHLYL
ncbi:MAG: DUF2982 domain-containing protein [Colwellia sp.]|nr:DUF2982 domain-containing protein [Colwellia sp.]